MMGASPRWVLPVAALLGASGVIAGAFAAHGLRGQVTADQLNAWETAAEYQLMHAVVLLAVSCWQPGFASNRLRPWLIRACSLMTVGIVIFSGSLYLLVLTGVGMLGAITPIGGTALVVAWLMLVRCGMLLPLEDTGASSGP